MKSKPKSLPTFVKELQRGARYSFTRAEASQALGSRPDALTKALQRLVRANRLCQVQRGFYAIVPVTLPPHALAPMAYIGPTPAYPPHTSMFLGMWCRGDACAHSSLYSCYSAYACSRIVVLMGMTGELMNIS